MSEDEVPRRRVPLLAAAVLVIGALAAWWWRGQISAEYALLKNFCNATRGGEPWSLVKDRAREKGWEPVKQSRDGVQPEEWLFVHEFSSYRAGCVVVLKKDRVVTTRFAQLPDDTY